MVGFQEKDVCGANAIQRHFGDMAQIRQEADAGGGGVQEKTGWILGVVGHAESVHGDIADVEGRDCFKEFEVQKRFGLALNGFLSEPVAVNGDFQFGAKHGERGNVIGMLVGDQDSREGFGGFANGGEALMDFAGAEAGIDENARTRCFQKGAIAFGTAAQDCELHRHAGQLKEGGGRGQPFSKELLETALFGACWG